MRGRIGALFTDIDGTLIPPFVRREEARLGRGVEERLRRIAERIKLATVTTKDYFFARRIIPFAHAWAVVGGIEIVTCRGEKFLADVDGGLWERIRQLSEDVEGRGGEYGLVVEKKLLSNSRDVAGLCLDWRYSGRREEAERLAEEVAEQAEKSGLRVMRYPSRPYIDIYVGEIDKGRAVRVLRRVLGVDGEVVYLGDSEADNPAFREADIGIGIIHEESPSGLEASQLVRFQELGELLDRILEQAVESGGDIRCEGN